MLCRAGLSLKRQDKLSAEVATGTLGDHDILLARPTTFMNESGRAVRAVTDYYRVTADRLLIAYDELDLAPGTVRLKQAGGHGGHNGLRDIFRHLEDTGFLRLRIGIGHPGQKDRVTPHVLGRPSATEELSIRESIEEALQVLPDVLDGSLEMAMNELHRKA